MCLTIIIGGNGEKGVKRTFPVIAHSLLPCQIVSGDTNAFKLSILCCEKGISVLL